MRHHANTLVYYFTSELGTTSLAPKCPLFGGSTVCLRCCPPPPPPWQAVKMTSVKTQLPYEYYSLPFCKPKEGDVHYKTLNLGQPFISPLINPRRACAARVTVVGSVCLSVCLLSHISPLERLFVLKTLSRTQRATKVKKFVGFSLKPLRCRDPALPPLTAIRTVGHFSCGKRHACAL